jgi:hypothetical protein
MRVLRQITSSKLAGKAVTGYSEMATNSRTIPYHQTLATGLKKWRYRNQK